MTLRITAFFPIALLVFGCSVLPTRGSLLESIGAGVDYASIAPQHRYDTFERNDETGITRQDLFRRVQVPPKAYLEYLRELDSKPSYRHHPLNKQQQKIVGQVLKQLPDALHDVLEERNVGVYFIEGFVTAGMTDWVIKPDGELYHVLVFNPIVLERSASEVLTWRERTAFRDDLSRHFVRFELSGVTPAFEYILLHEAAHAYDMQQRVTPYLEKAIMDYQPDNEPSAFLGSCWEAYRQASGSCDFPLREELSFYGLGQNDPIPASKMLQVYSDLESSSFVSLYGSLSWAEDFAELVAYHYLHKKYNVEPIIRVFQEGEQIKAVYPLRQKKVMRRVKEAGSLLNGLL